ncbi:hypothetical protein [Luteolibacter sp. Populi]|uniref:hypothetical protein n=1 Tax=Luteolibacter sp. Populi TaxID=3230487 RepID=UPI003465EDAF
MFFSSLTAARATHQAFVFITSGDVEFYDWFVTEQLGTEDVAIQKIVVGGAPVIVNGVPVVYRGSVTLDRFDMPADLPAAEHFFVAGDNFTLGADQSIWAFGSRLMVLEFGGNATFETGSLVNLSANNEKGGAGGGMGGAPNRERINYPSQDTKGIATPLYVVGKGGTAIAASTAGESGQRRARYTDNDYLHMVPEVEYASSRTGRTGGSGQGDRYFISFTEGLSGQATGGKGQLWSGFVPFGAAGGAGGGNGSSSPFGGGNGEDGENGQPGQKGSNGVNGANGSLQTLAGTAIHLRGGSGGGAGASGGDGLGGGTGGSGGGGGASGTGGIGQNLVNGGDGGMGGSGGEGGDGGDGGWGGGGGGGMLVLVRGTCVNRGNWKSKGEEGGEGDDGHKGLGFDGLDGAPGGARNSSLSLTSGKGGDGGRGGNGGVGGDGGKGASGSGGNIQIAAGVYVNQGATFDCSGGPGAPAGLAQWHGFNATSQNAPFGAFAAEHNSYRSFVDSYSSPIPPLPGKKPAHTPRLPSLLGGPAGYGLSTQFPDIVARTLSLLTPPHNCDAVVFRLNANDLAMPFSDYDILVYANVRPETFIPDPKVAAVSPQDSATSGNPALVTYLPLPQPLKAYAGYQEDSSLNPAGTGPVATNLPFGSIWITAIEKNKPFEVSGSWTPYGLPRTMVASPVRGSLYVFGTLPQDVLYLTDKGNPELVVEQASEYSVSTDEIMLETPGDHTFTRYVRLGSSPTYRYKVANYFGNPHSRAGGFLSCDYFRPDGLFMLGQSRSYGDRSNTDPQVAVEVTVPTQGRALFSEAVLSTGFISPDIDATERRTNVSMNARLVGPYPIVFGLTPTETGDKLKGQAQAAGQTVPMVFAMFNGNALPGGWSTDVYDKPKLTQLSILSAQIVGSGSAAFTLANPIPTVLDLGYAEDLTVNFTPPTLGTYAATLRLQTDAGAAFGQPGRVFEIPLQGTTGEFATWAASLPAGLRGADDDANQNGISNIIEYGLNGGGLGDLPKIISGSPSSQAQFNLPLNLRPDVLWAVDGSADLGSWQRVATRNPATGLWNTAAPLGAAAEQLLGGNRRVSLAMPGNQPKYFIRLVGDHVSNGYSNDFSTGAGATLRGPAVWDQASLRLSDGSPLGLGAAVLDGLSTWAGQTGFQATFQLQMESRSAEAGNGVAFAVGDLGTGAWAEKGPTPGRNLTVVFETYDFFSPPPNPRGFQIVVNGIPVATNPVPAFQSNYPEAIEVTYTPATGVSVRYKGTLVLTNVAVPGFTLQAGDQFGFSAYRGENVHLTRVKNVVIVPR